MKKQNNRYRNGNNNNGYTLNYKFDSVSIAGKISGTALDLIRRYNDLAKEAQSSGDYVDMEIYRQYAEHYRKIVTEINERRQTRMENNQARNNEADAQNSSEEMTEENAPSEEPKNEPETAPNGYVETLPAVEQPTKSFEVVEISNDENKKENIKPKRTYRRRTAVNKANEE
ncbi:MAG: DUF4167 domain-containing protein [Alphaproteobacteria bacterium]|nr:DUF4167 domain-containing protein [Alphaproteobacteria bacterium]